MLGANATRTGPSPRLTYMPRPDPGEARIAAYFVAAGAESPETARPLVELPPIDPLYLATLCARGVVHEATAGRFHWNAAARRPAPRRWGWWIVAALVVLLGPILFLHLTTPGPGAGTP